MRKQVVNYEVTCDFCKNFANKDKEINQYSIMGFDNDGERIDLCLPCSLHIDDVIRFFETIGIHITKKVILGTSVRDRMMK